jgi:hypothetical protein
MPTLDDSPSGRFANRPYTIRQKRLSLVGAHGVRPHMTTAAPVLTEQNSGAVLFAMGFTNILLLALAQAPRMQRQKERKT